MRRLTYLACILAVSVLVATMIGWAMANGNVFVPLAAIPLGIVVAIACRRNLQEATEDERLAAVRAQAALRTLELIIVAGMIAAVILTSFMVSESLSPTIGGQVYTGANGTVSMLIDLYKPGSPQTPDNLIRSTTIHDVNAMNETEADAYCRFREEAFGNNERNGITGMTIAGVVAAMLAAYGVFYLYYDKKY